jgi:hypothetical protein
MRHELAFRRTWKLHLRQGLGKLLGPRQLHNVYRAMPTRLRNLHRTSALKLPPVRSKREDVWWDMPVP